MRIVLSAAALAVLVGGCSVEPSPPGPPASPGDPEPVPTEFASRAEYGERREEALARLDAAVGPARATDEASCRVVAYGERGCGGPAGFRVYSSEGTDDAEVERLAAFVTALDSVAVRQFEIISTCEALLPPEPVLVDGRCQAE